MQTACLAFIISFGNYWNSDRAQFSFMGQMEALTNEESNQNFGLWTCILNGGHSCEMFTFNLDLLFSKSDRIEDHHFIPCGFEKIIGIQNDWTGFWIQLFYFNILWIRILLHFEYIEINKTFLWL